MSLDGKTEGRIEVREDNGKVMISMLSSRPINCSYGDFFEISGKMDVINVFSVFEKLKLARVVFAVNEDEKGNNV